MSATPNNHFHPSSGAPPTPRQNQRQQPPAQYTSSIPNSLSNSSSTNANSNAVNASMNPTVAAPTASTVIAAAPSSRSTTTPPPLGSRAPITMAGHITIVGGKVTSGTTRPSSTKQSASNDNETISNFKITIPPPHPAGRYANETLAILGSAFSEKRSPKSREECIKILEKSVPTMAFRRSVFSAIFEGERLVEFPGGRKRKSPRLFELLKTRTDTATASKPTSNATKKKRLSVNGEAS